MPIQGENNRGLRAYDRPDLRAAEARPRRRHGHAHAVVGLPGRVAADLREVVLANRQVDPFAAPPLPPRPLRPRNRFLVEHMEPAPGAVPENLNGVDSHRAGADRDTQKSMLAVYKAFPVDAPEADAALDEIERFILRHVGNSANVGDEQGQPQAYGPVRRDDAQLRDKAMRTLNQDPSTLEFAEPFTSLRNPLNTYGTGPTNEHVTLPTRYFAASVWKAIGSLPRERQHGARLLFVSALAACQQLGHICAPGQLQQLAAHMAPELPELFKIRRPVRETHDYSAELFRFIKRKAGGNSHPVPASERASILEFADKVWGNLVREDAQEVSDGYLDAYSVPERKHALRDEMNRLLNDTYDLEWPLPELQPLFRRPPTPIPAQHQIEALAAFFNAPEPDVGINALRHGIVPPLEGWLNQLLMQPAPANNAYGQLLREIGGAFMQQRVNGVPDLMAFHQHAREQGLARWPNDHTQRVFFDVEVRRFLFANFLFVPDQRDV